MPFTPFHISNAYYFIKIPFYICCFSVICLPDLISIIFNDTDTDNDDNAEFIQ